MKGYTYRQNGMEDKGMVYKWGIYHNGVYLISVDSEKDAELICIHLNSN